MPVSYAELKALLDVDEPDYAPLAAIASGALQHLRKLASSPDESVASKAVSLAGIIGDAGSIGVISNAAKSPHALVRVAAAHAASLLPDTPQAARVVHALLNDRDIGVIKLATRAAARQSDPRMAAKAKQANTRMMSAVRASVKASSQRERATAMATKASKKAGGTATAKMNRKVSGKAAAGEMPTGAMTEPPKAAKGMKARAMPSGKMN
jgi:HEAT repeat protein